MTERSLELPEPTPSADPAAEREAAATASPTAPTTTLVLEAPRPVAPVAPDAAGAVPIPAADQAKLDAMVAGYLDAVTTLDVHSQAFTDQVRDIGSSATTTSGRPRHRSRTGCSRSRSPRCRTAA